MAERTRRIESGEQVVVGRQPVHRDRAARRSATAESILRGRSRRGGGDGRRRRRRGGGRARRRRGATGARRAAPGGRRRPRTSCRPRSPWPSAGGTTGEWAGCAARGVRRVPGARPASAAAAGRRAGELAAVAERVRAMAGGPPRLLVAKPGPRRPLQRRRADRRRGPRRRHGGRVLGHPAHARADRGVGTRRGPRRRRPVDPVRQPPRAGARGHGAARGRGRRRRRSSSAASSPRRTGCAPGAGRRPRSTRRRTSSWPGSWTTSSTTHREAPAAGTPPDRASRSAWPGGAAVVAGGRRSGGGARRRCRTTRRRRRGGRRDLEALTLGDLVGVRDVVGGDERRHRDAEHLGDLRQRVAALDDVLLRRRRRGRARARWCQAAASAASVVVVWDLLSLPPITPHPAARDPGDDRRAARRPRIDGGCEHAHGAILRFPSARQRERRRRPGPGAARLVPNLAGRMTSDRRPPRSPFPAPAGPTRTRTVDANGVEHRRLRVGRPDAPPIFCLTAASTSPRTFDLLAPLLADAGWRVVSLGPAGPRRQRPGRALLVGGRRPRRRRRHRLGHRTGRRRVVGHSKGGQPGDAARRGDAAPRQPPHQPRRPAVEAPALPTSPTTTAPACWPPSSRTGSTTAAGPPTPSAGRARSRSWPSAAARMNPRLSREWLRYIASIGARHDEDGWRWKLDPSMRFGGFGPWRPEWSLHRMAGPRHAVPRRARPRVRGDGLGHPSPRTCGPGCRAHGRFVTLPDAGHFVHIEQPDLVADLILDFLR